MFPLKQSTKGFYGTFLVVLFHCHRKFLILCRYAYMMLSVASQKSGQMFRTRMKKRFIHGDSEWQCPLILLRQTQFNTHLNLFLSNPYNRISTFELNWFILELGYILNVVDGHCQGHKELAKGISGTAVILNMSGKLQDHDWSCCFFYLPHPHLPPSPLRQTLHHMENAWKLRWG